MTLKEFNKLKRGDLVEYDNKHTKTKANKCYGLILEVEGFYEIKNGQLADGTPCYRTCVKLIQPYIKSDFEMYINNNGGGLKMIHLVENVTRR